MAKHLSLDALRLIFSYDIDCFLGGVHAYMKYLCEAKQKTEMLERRKVRDYVYVLNICALLCHSHIGLPSSYST